MLTDGDDLSNQPIWRQALPPSAPARGGAEAIEADLAVIGSGLTGLSAAYHALAARPGLRVVVLEAERLGHGASSRNTGMLPAALDRLHKISGGASETELNELAVMPINWPWSARVVITVTPVANCPSARLKLASSKSGAAARLMTADSLQRVDLYDLSYIMTWIIDRQAFRYPRGHDRPRWGGCCCHQETTC